MFTVDAGFGCQGVNPEDLENQTADMEDKVNRCTTNEEAEKVIQEFKEIIKNKKIDIM